MGTKSTTSYDVARRAGVAQSTVSRALRNDPKVAPETRELIQRIARELSYVPNLMARSLITGTNATVAVVVPDLQNPIYPIFIDTIQATLTQRGYLMILLTDRTEGGHESDLEVLKGGIASGTIFMQARIGSTLAEDLVSAGLPLVVLGRDVTAGGSDMVDRVTSDDSHAGRLAADYLYGLGHRHVALLSGPEGIPSIRFREEAFLARLAELGLTGESVMLRRGPIEPSTGQHFAEEVAALKTRPTAILCGTDYMAFGFLERAAHLGLRVPEDVQVLGVGDLPMASWSNFDLTTIQQPLHEMAYTATTLLLDRLEGRRESGPTRLVFPVKLIQRGSTADLETIT